MAVEHFWQNFPKAIEADGRRLTLRLLPRQFADAARAPGRRAEDARASRSPSATIRWRATPLVWGRAPSLAAATPRVVCRDRGGAVPDAGVPRTSTPGIGVLVDAAIEGDETFERKREVIDEYGWRHFGDIYADHENPFSGEAEPLVSHYNNQYDAIAGFARSVPAHRRRPVVAADDELAAHVIDIDIYHTDATRRRTTTACSGTRIHYVAAGTSHPPVVSAPRRRLRRRARQRAQLHHRPDAALAPDRRSAVARGGDRPGDVGHRHGRRPEDDSPLAGAATPGWPARRSRPTTTARAAAPGTRSTRCSTGIG